MNQSKRGSRGYYIDKVKSILKGASIMLPILIVVNIIVTISYGIPSQPFTITIWLIIANVLVLVVIGAIIGIMSIIAARKKEGE
jgi:hypothetical protein